MKVFMTGGTGFVGTVLTKSLTQKGYKVTLLTRKIRGDRSVPRGATLLEGDPAKAGQARGRGMWLITMSSSTWPGHPFSRGGRNVKRG
ncbi:MAG: NAD(P)-dependent oxidoreductase [Deltaproteobacteria bacterium]|nr:NAD(P)-dependent oxidoreductase [Deltaproteobacteria bacterium]